MGPLLERVSPAQAIPARVRPLSALTSLRFFAAMHVVLFHTYPWSTLAASEHRGAQLFARFCERGFVAVGFFFTLSGFILAYNYPVERAHEPRTFYRARFARIYPVYLLGLAVSIPFFAVRTLRSGDYASSVLELLLAVSLLQAWLPAYWSAINPPGWSLSVEAFFYVAFPSLSRFVATRARSPQRLAGWLVVLYLCALGPAALGIMMSSTGLPRRDESLLANTLRYLPLLSLPEFVFGVVLAHIHRANIASTKLLARLLLPTLAVASWLLLSGTVPDLLLHNGLLLPAFGVLILAGARPGLVERALSSDLLQLLGEASYALYILHSALWVWLKIVLERCAVDVTAGWVFPTYAVLAVALSVLAYRLVEVPARLRLLKR